MAVLRYIVPAVAAAAGVAAQFGSSGSACSAAGSTTTLQSQADATGLAGCTTYTGSIAIASSTTEDISLNGVQRITGDLVATNVSMVSSISAGQLSEIGGEFHLDGATTLGTLQFPALVKVKSIYWNALPQLSSLSFAQGVQQLSSMIITNTFLSSLKGINLQMADHIELSNNEYLNDVTMQLGNITQALILSFNGPKLNVQLPNLMWAYNVSLRGLDQISIPSLASVNSSFGLFSGTFNSLSTPNLTNVGGFYSVTNNLNCANISAPQLTQVGAAFTIVNNSLSSIDGFPLLSTIGGAAVFGGSFDNISLPALQNVRGAFYINAASQATCNQFQKISPAGGSNPIIKGKFGCVPLANKTSSSSGSGTSSGASASSTTGAAASVMIPGAATGILGLVAIMFGML